MEKPVLVEQYSDNGEFSHWHLVDKDGSVLWSSFPEETEARGQKISSLNVPFILLPTKEELNDYVKSFGRGKPNGVLSSTAEQMQKDFMNGSTHMYNKIKILLRKAFEAGCEVYYDDNDGMTTMSQSLVEIMFNEWCKDNNIIN